MPLTSILNVSTLHYQPCGKNKACKPPSRILNWLIATLILLAAASGIVFTARNGRLPDLECRQNQTDIYLPLDSQSPLVQTIQPTADHFTSLTIYAQAGPESPHSITIRPL